MLQCRNPRRMVRCSKGARRAPTGLNEGREGAKNKSCKKGLMVVVMAAHCGDVDVYYDSIMPVYNLVPPYPIPLSV